MMELDKKSLSERDICTKFITPAILSVGWDRDSQIREEVHLTKGRVIVKKKLISRGKSKFADYVLFFKPNIPVAVVEAKDNRHGVGDGMQQALEYAEMMDVPFVYSSNGDAFLEHNKTMSSGILERELALRDFPSPGDLWRQYCAWKGLDSHQAELVTQDYYYDGSDKMP